MAQTPDQKKRTPQLTLNLHRLAEYGARQFAASGELWNLEITSLEGGYASNRVFRHDLTFRFTDGQFQTISVVQKYTGEAEVYVMELLSELGSTTAIPQLIDGARGDRVADKKGDNWFIVPFYPGNSLTFEDEVPTSVIKSLAQLHAHFAPRVNSIEMVEGLYHVDLTFFNRTFKNALKGLVQLQEKQPSADLGDMQIRLEEVSQCSVFETALKRLPVTLVHGDVHPENILCLDEGRAVLIDWGNARIAPAMLDVANLVELGSENWNVYLKAWEEASGEVVDMPMARLNYYWATAMVNLQYLPFAAEFSQDNILGMIDRICDARLQMEMILG